MQIEMSERDNAKMLADGSKLKFMNNVAKNWWPLSDVIEQRVREALPTLDLWFNPPRLEKLIKIGIRLIYDSFGVVWGWWNGREGKDRNKERERIESALKSAWINFKFGE